MTVHNEVALRVGTSMEERGDGGRCFTEMLPRNPELTHALDGSWHWDAMKPNT